MAQAQVTRDVRRARRFRIIEDVIKIETRTRDVECWDSQSFSNRATERSKKEKHSCYTQRDLFNRRPRELIVCTARRSLDVVFPVGLYQHIFLYAIDFIRARDSRVRGFDTACLIRTTPFIVPSKSLTFAVPFGLMFTTLNVGPVQSDFCKP